MTFTSIIEKDPTRLRGAQCADLRSVGTSAAWYQALLSPSLAPPPESLGTRLEHTTPLFIGSATFKIALSSKQLELQVF